MTEMIVAYPGEEGAYAAEAGAQLYPDAQLMALRSFAEVMRAVKLGEAGYGVLPIENSLAGAVPETYDLLAHAPLAIVAETVLPVPHVLVGVAVAPHPPLRRDGEQWRCAIRFVTHHHPGALHEAIEPLRRFGVNMTSLQSRPIPGRPWDYQFYADIEGHPMEKSVGEALAAMQ